MCDMLLPMTSLRELRLDLAYPDTVKMTGVTRYDTGKLIDDLNTFVVNTRQRATLVLNRLPQLTSVGFSFVDMHMKFYWMTFTLAHDETGGGDVRLGTEKMYLYVFDSFSAYVNSLQNP